MPGACTTPVKKQEAEHPSFEKEANSPLEPASKGQSFTGPNQEGEALLLGMLPLPSAKLLARPR